MENEKGTGQALNTIAKGVVDGTGAFLGRICNPAAEEFGLLLRDKVKHWRNKNFIKIATESEKLVSEKKESKNPHIHPRVLHAIYEHGSWSEDDKLQKMWSGLLASSCYDEGSDKSIFYVDILSKMSSDEAALFEYICKSSEWRISWSENLVEALPSFSEPHKLKEVTKLVNYEDIDEAISHLETLGLIKHESHSSYGKMDEYDSVETKSFNLDSSGLDGEWINHVELSLTNLGIRLFLKVQGIDQRPSEYFKDKVPKEDEDDSDWYYYDEWRY